MVGNWISGRNGADTIQGFGGNDTFNLDVAIDRTGSVRASVLKDAADNMVKDASDALDKLRLESFRDKDLDVDTSDLHIEVDIDKPAPETPPAPMLDDFELDPA